MPPPPPPLPLGCVLRASCSFEVLPTSSCSLWHPKFDDAMHLALPPSHCKPVHLVGLTLNYSRWCVLHTNLSYFCLTSNNLNPPAVSIYPQLDSLRRQRCNYFLPVLIQPVLWMVLQSEVLYGAFGTPREYLRMYSLLRTFFLFLIICFFYYCKLVPLPK